MIIIIIIIIININIIIVFYYYTIFILQINYSLFCFSPKTKGGMIFKFISATGSPTATLLRLRPSHLFCYYLC